MHAVHKNGKKSINLRDFPNDICFLLTEISTNFFFSFRMKFHEIHFRSYDSLGNHIIMLCMLLCYNIIIRIANNVMQCSMVQFVVITFSRVQLYIGKVSTVQPHGYFRRLS
jgi:hypothetical protein